MGSDEEDYVLDNGGPSEEQVFGFGDAFVNANNREGGGVFVHRRRDGGKFFFFFPVRVLTQFINLLSGQRRLPSIWAIWKQPLHSTRGNNSSFVAQQLYIT